jgi:predicted dehydrogenase
VRDVGVVLDLAPHDIDVLRFLFGASVERVYSETEQKINTAHEDMVSATIRFTNGVVASLDINWLTPTKVRTLTVTGERGMFEVDYLTQDLEFYANDYALTRWEALRALSGVSEGTMTRYRIAKEEPLRNELLAFVNAVAQRRAAATASGPDAPSPVSAMDGLEALRLATLLVESGRLGQAIQVRHGNLLAA